MPQRVVGALAFELACSAVMLWLALWAEARPAPTLPDLVLPFIPYSPWVDRYNYVLWLLAYFPVALWLLFNHAERFIRYTWTAGLLALVRGVCLVATGLGPINGSDVHAGMDLETRWRAFLTLVNPLHFFAPDGGANAHLTKDLFFSGHTATTLLLLLYVWRFPGARAAMLLAHVAVVASLFLAHLHYTIDVLAAYAFTLAVFTWREGHLGATLERR